MLFRSYAAGRQQVANQPLANVDARMLRDAAIRASAMVNPMDVASMFTEAPLPGSSARLLESLQAKETAKMTPEQLGRRSAQDDVLNALELGAGAAMLPGAARGLRGMFYDKRMVPKVVPESTGLAAFSELNAVRPVERRAIPQGRQEALPQPPAGPYGGEDLYGFLGRLNRDMDEINASARANYRPPTPRPMPTEQMSLGLDMPTPAPRADFGVSRGQLEAELRDAIAATPGDINRVARLRRLGGDIANFGDLTGIPRDVVMRNLQTAFKRPFPKKGGLSAAAEQQSLSLPERGRVAKRQYMLIDPWGESYSSVPVLFKNGGYTKG